MAVIPLMQQPVSIIDFKDISSIPQLIKDFLAKEIPGFENQTFSPENIERQISEKKASFTIENRAVLYEVLRNQMEPLGISTAQHKNLENLKKEAFTVVTGHQLNLFSGPAFFIYKILQTIKTAEYLNSIFRENSFVPVFWMASEDHDFDEINHFRTAEHYYAIKADSGGPVGRISVEENSFIDDFEKEFKDTVFGTELIRWVKESYEKGNSLSKATRTLVNRLFSEYGLLVLDGDEKELKATVKDVFKDELFKQKLFNSTSSTVSFLKKKYGKVQVNPREVNLFYIKDKRERIDPKGGDFQLSESGKKFSAEEILHELENHPENFSPNALLRPVYLEMILPNVAYIGGNAEIMYWLELKDYFKHLNLPFPVLIPRNSMLFLTKKTLEKVRKAGLQPEDFFKDFAAVINRELLKESTLDEIISQKEKMVRGAFEELKIKSAATDITFKNLVEAEQKRQLKSYERMKKRLLRAEKIKQKEKVERLEKLFVEVHPYGNWQERVYNLSVYYADNGWQWLQTCYEMMDDSKSNLIIMQI